MPPVGAKRRIYSPNLKGWRPINEMRISINLGVACISLPLIISLLNGENDGWPATRQSRRVR